MTGFEETIGRLLLGLLLGGIVGFERQSHGRPAGLRTHILVCTASVLVMIISRDPGPLGHLAGGQLQLDPSRLAAGAITGIGFLGAGVIVKSGVTVQGLTTAASIWMVSVIGLAVGSGLYVASLTALAITVGSLWTLRLLEGKVIRTAYRSITLHFDRGGHGMEKARRHLDAAGVAIEHAEFCSDAVAGEETIRLNVSRKGEGDWYALMNILASLPGIRRVDIGT
jgi:putative Mg2+ transporter-C (MgtC) family protein